MVPLSRLCLVHTQIPSMVTPTLSQRDNFLRAFSQDPAILSRKRHKELNCFLAGGFCGLIPISQKLMITADSISPWPAQNDTQMQPRVGGDLHHLVEWDSVKVPLSSPAPTVPQSRSTQTPPRRASPPSCLGDGGLSGNRKSNGRKGEMKEKGLTTNGILSAERRTTEAELQDTREH